MKEQKVKLLLGSLSFGVVIFYLFLFSHVPLLQPDSLSYISFSPTRPIGYPLFLWIVEALTGSHRVVPFLQLFFYVGASFYCAMNFYALSRSLILTTGLLLGILVNIQFIRLAFSILTDSVGGGLLLLFLGMIFSFSSHPRLKTLYGIWGIIGVACLIRPVFYCLIGVLPVLYFFKWDFLRGPILKTILGPLSVLLVLLVFGSFGQYINHGFFRGESFLGNNLIGKVGLIGDPSIPSKHPSVMHAFGKKSQEIRQILDTAPSLRLRYLLSAPYYDTVRFSIAPPLFPPLKSTDAVDSFSKELALEVIKGKPFEYAQDVFMNYMALWQMWDFYSFTEGKEFQILLKTLSTEQTLNAMYVPYSIRAEANGKFGFSAVALTLRCALAVAFVLSFLFPFTAFFLWAKGKSLSPLILSGTLVSLTIQGGCLLTALLQAGIARYALLFWPCVIILLALFLKLILGNLKFR